MTEHNSASSAAGGPADCPECGTRTAPGQSFCDGCGTVLGWKPPKLDEGRPGAPGTPAGSGSPAAPSPDTVGPEETTLRQDAVGGAGTAAPQGAADPRSAGPAPYAADPRSAAAAPYAAASPEPAQPDTTATPEGPAAATPYPGAAAPADRAQPPHDQAAADERARALLIPVADPEERVAATPVAAPVLPGRPEAARPVAQGPAMDPGEDGGPPCPWCSTGNRPDRHFCRRCAMSLAARPDAPVRLPWWRRILDRRNRPAPWAGSRPRLRRDLGAILTWALRLIVVGLVVYGLFNIGTAVDAVRDHFAKRAQVSPEDWAASRSFPDHGPELVGDKFNNTWWGPGVSQSGEGEWVEARFHDPVRLLDLMITPGISTRPADLTKAALPHRLEARVTTAEGKHFTRTLNLDQASGAQRIPFRVGEISSVRFTVASSYGTGSKKQVSLAEIEFFARSQSSTS
ncbi:NADase-type glycan-binding domain-containing protein [Streptomyces sp. CA-132043]|uniref:NADase-type glycan-binding domain-containing protein n=1 Tax=Streptomyces sp. CA-132043 TaxID=3240048 RepID=UPI003D8EFDFF